MRPAWARASRMTGYVQTQVRAGAGFAATYDIINFLDGLEKAHSPPDQRSEQLFSGSAVFSKDPNQGKLLVVA